jgi:hypothetical protein
VADIEITHLYRIDFFIDISLLNGLGKTHDIAIEAMIIKRISASQL